MILPKSIFLLSIPIFLLADNYQLTEMEKRSVTMAKKWINNNSKIIKQKDGSLAFYYGDNMPSLICKPSLATVIKLEKGEKVEALKSGDPEQWKFDTVEKERSFVLVKPVRANIMTNLIIFTDRRIYNIKLISTKNSWLPSISFIYDKNEEMHTDLLSSETSPKNKSNKTQKSTPKHDSSEYFISSNGWKPNKVYTKHGKTYIDLKGIDKGNLPKLFVMNRNKSRPVHYTYKNHQFVVNGIVKKAILVKDGLSKTIIHLRRKK